MSFDREWTEKDKKQFWHTLLIGSGIFNPAIPIAVYGSWALAKLGIFTAEKAAEVIGSLKEKYDRGKRKVPCELSLPAPKPLQLPAPKPKTREDLIEELNDEYHRRILSLTGVRGLDEAEREAMKNELKDWFLQRLQRLMGGQ